MVDICGYTGPKSNHSPSRHAAAALYFGFIVIIFILLMDISLYFLSVVKTEKRKLEVIDITVKLRFAYILPIHLHELFSLNSIRWKHYMLQIL